MDSELKDWTLRQLQYKSATLAGQVDGLVDYRRSLHEELQQTIQGIKNLEELRRTVDIDQDQDTLEHLRRREMEIRKEIQNLNGRIRELGTELDAVNLELAARPPGDEEMDRYLARQRRESEKRIRKVIHGTGFLGRLRSWFLGS